MNFHPKSFAPVAAIDFAPAPRINWDLLAATRFVLAFIVIQFHQFIFFEPNAFNAVMAQLGGKASVVGFLVISGFSIHASLARKSENFVARRLLRIYPAYVAALLLSFLLQWRFQTYAAPQTLFEPNSPALFACNAALLQMYACKAIGYDGVVWSLSIEFSFYLLVYFARRLPDMVFLGLAVASLIVFCLPHDLSDAAAYHLLMRFNAAKYLWAFLFGYLLFRHPGVRPLAVFGALSALAFAVSPERSETLGPLTILATFAMIGLATRLSGVESRVLNVLGDVSYPLYLMHIPLYIALGGFFGTANAVILTLVALAGAVFTLEVVEKPFRRALHRFGSLRV
jgi:peptidoglycan/LPS O-acetylase OafA/YrhL